MLLLKQRLPIIINSHKSLIYIILVIMLVFSNVIISNKIENSLTMKTIKNNNKNEICSSKLKNKKKAKKSIEEAILLVKCNENLNENDLTSQKRADNIAFLEKASSNMHFKMNNKLKSKAEMKTELLALKRYVTDIKDELNTNKNLPVINPLITNIDEDIHWNDKETVITTEEFSTDLRLSKEKIGYHLWTVLHSMASAYPLRAEEVHQQAIRSFIEKM